MRGEVFYLGQGKDCWSIYNKNLYEEEDIFGVCVTHSRVVSSRPSLSSVFQKNYITIY